MMKSSELGVTNPTGIFPRRPLRSQTYNILVRVLHCCDALQAASSDTRNQQGEGVLELDSALIKASSVLDEARGNGGVTNVGNEELMVVDGVENCCTSSLGREHSVHDGGSGNVVCEPVNTPASKEVVEDVVRLVGIEVEMSPVSAVNLSEGMEHDLQLKQQELEELLFSPQDMDLSVANDGAEEGEISGGYGVDEGAVEFLFGDSVSLEEKKQDGLLGSELENDNGGDGQGRVEGGNGFNNVERTAREERNVGAKSSRDNACSNYMDLDGGRVEKQVSGAKELHHSVISSENLAQRRQITYEEDITHKKGSATAPMEVGKTKKRRGRRGGVNKKVGAKSSRDIASSNYIDLDGGRVEEQVSGAKESHHPIISSVDLAQRRQITYEDITDNKGSETAPLEVGKNKERKSRGGAANRKRKDRIKRAEKNKEIGVKRLKLEPVVIPKKVVYCRHYVMGRCHEGEKCNFSHDTTPSTKSTPCSFFAQHSCMKGDDCPFDHDLSKYPCHNFVSQGFCSRGADCLFKHEASNINDPSLISKLSKPELKSQLPMGGSNSSNQVNNKEVAYQHSHTKFSSLNPSTGKMSEHHVPKNPIPRGISFLPQLRSQITDASKHKEAAPILKLKDRVESSSSTVSNQLDNFEKFDAPKGINFLSFGKSPLGISASKEKGTVGFPTESVKSSSGSNSVSSVLAHGQEKRNAGGGLVPSVSTPNGSSALGSHTLSPFSIQCSGNGVGGSSSSKTPVVFNTPASVQRALKSTLAFAAKIDSGIRLNIPSGNPFDASGHDSSNSTIKG